MSDIVRTFRCVYGYKSRFEDVISDNYFLFVNYLLIALLIHCCCLCFLAPKLVCVTLILIGASVSESLPSLLNKECYSNTFRGARLHVPV